MTVEIHFPASGAIKFVSLWLSEGNFSLTKVRHFLIPLSIKFLNPKLQFPFVNEKWLNLGREM